MALWPIPADPIPGRFRQHCRPCPARRNRKMPPVPAAAGEDRQLAPLTIFKPQKGRNHAKNAKIVKIVNVLY
jgi:hypothetical protein